MKITNMFFDFIFNYLSYAFIQGWFATFNYDGGHAFSVQIVNDALPILQWQVFGYLVGPGAVFAVSDKSFRINQKEKIELKMKSIPGGNKSGGRVWN